jgi:hypothetical protein
LALPDPPYAKARFVVAVIALPILYALNIGPVFYSVQHFGVHSWIAFALYDPLINALSKTPLAIPYGAVSDLVDGPSLAHFYLDRDRGLFKHPRHIATPFLDAVALSSLS